MSLISNNEVKKRVLKSLPEVGGQAYDNDKQYSYGDVATYTGKAFIANKSTTGTVKPADWDLINPEQGGVAWASDVFYAEGDTVVDTSPVLVDDYKNYMCLIDHTSGKFASDVSAQPPIWREFGAELPHGYLAETGQASYTPDAKGLDFFEYVLTEDTTIQNIINRNPGNKGTIILHQDPVGGWAVTWGDQYLFPGDAADVSDVSNAYSLFDYKVVGKNVIVMEYVAEYVRPPVPLTVTWNSLAADSWVTLTGAPMEYSNDAGATWTDIPVGVMEPLVMGATNDDTLTTHSYILRETEALGAVTGFRFGEDAFGVDHNIDGRIIVTGGENLVNCYRMFFYGQQVLSIDVTGMITKNVTNMDNMFGQCPLIMSLDVSGFDTSNVTTFQGFFGNCNLLATLDVSGFNTSSVTDTGWMFSSNDIVSIDVSGFNTSSVTNMVGMFSSTSLVSLDVTNFDTSKVTNMQSLFSSNKDLTSLDVSNFNTSMVTNMDSTFGGCDSFTSLDISNFDGNAVTTTYRMFAFSDIIVNIKLGTFGGSSNLNTSQMFRGCPLLECISGNLDTTTATNKTDMFDSSTALVQPSAIDQADIIDVDGANWTGPACP